MAHIPLSWYDYDHDLSSEYFSLAKSPFIKDDIAVYDDIYTSDPTEELLEKLQGEFDELRDHYKDATFRQFYTEKESQRLEQVKELLDEYKAVEDELQKLRDKSWASAALEKEVAELLRQMCHMLVTSCALLHTCRVAGGVMLTKSRAELLLKTATAAARKAEGKFDQHSDSVKESRHTQDRYSECGRRMALMLCVVTGVSAGVCDYRMMRKLFQRYGFDYTIQINPTKQEMGDAVLTFRDRINQCREDMACCFVVSTSHGDVGTVIGSDGGKTKVDEIILPFGDDKCPKLREKPKVFIIDACRGVRRDVGVGVDDPACFDPMAEGKAAKELENYIQPTISEMFSMFASQPEFVAFMRKGGSELIRNTAEVFSTASGSEHIYDLFVKVNEKIAMETYKCKDEITMLLNDCKVMPQIDSTLTKFLYLSPR